MICTRLQLHLQLQGAHLAAPSLQTRRAHLLARRELLDLAYDRFPPYACDASYEGSPFMMSAQYYVRSPAGGPTRMCLEIASGRSCNQAHPCCRQWTAYKLEMLVR